MDHRTNKTAGTETEWLVVVTHANGEIATSPLKSVALRIGRSDNCDVIIRDDRASRLHCIIGLVGSRPNVVDQSSKNGTFVNGVRVNQAWLEHDDVVSVADTRIRIEECVKEKREAEYSDSLKTPKPIRPSSIPGLPPDASGAMSHLALIYRLSTVLSSTDEVESTADAIATLVLEAIPVDRVFVMLGDSVTSIQAIAQRPTEAHLLGPPSMTVIENTLKKNSTLICSNMDESNFTPTESLLNADVKIIMCAPIYHSDEILGVLYADGKHEAELDQKSTRALFEAITVQAALAIGKAQLHRELLDKHRTITQQRDELKKLNLDLSMRVSEQTALAEYRSEELSRRLRQLEHLSTCREIMAKTLVHDIRNLTVAVTSNLRFLQGRMDNDEDAHNAVRDATEASTIITEMVEDVLTASKMEHGTFALNTEQTPTSELLMAAQRRHQRQAIERNISLICNIEDVDPVVTVDRKVMGRVLDNLISNALRFAGSEGEIQLISTLTAQKVELHVFDTGPGVPEKERDRIFDLGYRADSAAKVRHHGIGLYFCRLAVEAHGGAISVTGGKGSNRFVVEVPSASSFTTDESTHSGRSTQETTNFVFSTEKMTVLAEDKKNLKSD